METRRGYVSLAGLLGLLLLVSGARTAAINKRPTTGIEPFVCPSKSGQSGICMYAWHCLLFKGNHLGTCYDGVFVGSCCLLPPASSTSSNDVLPGTARPEPVTVRPPSSPVTLDWRPVTSTSVVTSMVTSSPPETEDKYSLETGTSHGEPTTTTEWYTTEKVTPEEEDVETEEPRIEEDEPVTSAQEIGASSDRNVTLGPSVSPVESTTTQVPVTSSVVSTDSPITTAVPVTTSTPVTATTPAVTTISTTTTPVPTITVSVTTAPSANFSTTTPRLRPTTTPKPKPTSQRPNPTSSKPKPPTSKPSTAAPEVTTAPLPNRTTEALQNYKEVCGKPQLGPRGRIVGGVNSHYAEWPWMISLRQWKKSTFLHKCGAALLNGLWAITAAHCVESVPPGDILLRLGEYDVSNDKEPEVFEERRVQIVASHPKFDPRTFEYDLALLRFYQPVRFRRNILPICIPHGDELFVGKTATVTGWGRLYEDGPLPSVMQEVQVPIITNAECESMYKKAGFVEDIPDIFICAGKAEGGKDSCEGDSGGPMVLKDAEGRWILAGIISWGIGCALPNQPGVYTRITKFASWIDQIIAF